MDRIVAGRFEDTNRLFVPPQHYDVRVDADGTPEVWAEHIAALLAPTFDPKRPTALFVGRYQPFHDGHRALVFKDLQRVGQACITVRNTEGTSPSDPFGFEYVKARIETDLRDYAGRFIVVQLPNIAAIFYGRDAGYQVEQPSVDANIAALSATEVRRQMRLQTAVPST
ncbi:hypothetical protein [Sphingomonas sp.]|uniref:hypothetical protein n=1 Tax=Sphingomonas sp. TaxID=28214 RepID=UPI00260069BF|nr:hypothetical protein [Sphingomonas sp.]